VNTFMNFAEIEGCDEINMLRESLDESYAGYLVKGTDTMMESSPFQCSGFDVIC